MYIHIGLKAHNHLQTDLHGDHPLARNYESNWFDTHLNWDKHRSSLSQPPPTAQRLELTLITRE